MARQRFIHPEFWTDPSIGKLMPIERLMFIGCFSNADDEGRLLGNPAYLRATIFPYDDLSLKEVKAMRDKMVKICKNIILYEVDEEEYLALLNWDKYQKPKYPKPSKLPPPPTENDSKTFSQIGESFLQNGENIGETFPQDSTEKGETVEEAFHHGMGLGRDGFGMDRDRDGMGLDRDGMEAQNQNSASAPNDLESVAKPNSVDEKPKKSAKAAKIKYAEFVSMTEQEYQTLVDRFGEENTKRMVEVLDNYKGAHGKRYKSDYRAILTWVADRVLKEREPPVWTKREDAVGPVKSRAEPQRIPRAFKSLMEWAEEEGSS